MAAAKNPPVESDADLTIGTTRVIAASPARLFEAFRDSHQLEQWWGPMGFTCTIQEFDLRPGGQWRLVLHGPDGADDKNEKVFTAVVPGERIVFRHLDPVHAFEMTIAYAARDAGTWVTWRLVSDSVAECVRVRAIVTEANEQNLDRLESHVRTLL